MLGNRIGLPGSISPKTILWIIGLMLRSFVPKILASRFYHSLRSHPNLKFNQSKNSTVLSKTVRLERHKQQSPVKNQNPILSKNIVGNTAKLLQNSNTQFQLHLSNRFAPPPPPCRTWVCNCTNQTVPQLHSLVCHIPLLYVIQVSLVRSGATKMT